MADNIKLSIEQTREKPAGVKTIFRLNAEWMEMEDWEANKVLRDTVVAITEKSAEWDKALTGGPPTK